MFQRRSGNSSRMFAGATILALLVPLGAARAGDEKVLYSFQASPDGAEPYAGLIASKKGDLYGTTYAGGDGCKTHTCGTVFKISPDGAESVIYSFAKGTGEYPNAALFADSAGALYGTTEKGGNGCKGTCGTVYKVTPSGQEKVIYAFKGRDAGDGAFPMGPLIGDSAGNLYGTTWRGGGGDCQGGCGTVFRVAPGGAEAVVYAFLGGSDGSYPLDGLLADSAGNFYGTTSAGGARQLGTVFKITPGGSETVLYSFCTLAGCTDGATPWAGLIADASGNLYGTTTAGGPGYGSVFKLAPDGTETVLYNFKGKGDGGFPAAGVVLDEKGNLYETTSAGSTNGGAVFKISSDGKEETLHEFAGGTDGAGPYGTLIFDKKGNLYGTTLNGGDPNCGSNTGCGTVFEIHK